MDFGPWFLVKPVLAGLFYLLYLLAPLLAFWLWRSGRRMWVWLLAVLWAAGAFAVPLVDYQRARLQAEANWGLAVLPEILPIDGMSFVTGDTVRTPHTAIHRFNAPEAIFGLYNLDDVTGALITGPVDFADLRFFEHVPAPGQYKDRRTEETPAGTRVQADYLMWADFSGPERAILEALNHPATDTLPQAFGADFAIIEVTDPAAFDLRAARLIMLLPYASQSYFPWPFNPFVRHVYSAVDYATRRDIQLRLFCSKVTGDDLDRCRRDM